MTSLIATVLNEKNNLMDWLRGILAQSVLPQEIIIVDGGSGDGTWEMLQEVAGHNSLIKVFQHAGNISAGRNFAISKAQYDFIIVTDAGCTYDKNWFKKISGALMVGKSALAATSFGPWFKENDSFVTRLIAAATIPVASEFKRDWIPSSRSVAFKKEVWQKVGGYPEWIPLCEDVVFDLKIFKLGIKPDYIREPLVFWRPRTTLKTYFKQLFGYTRSDGHGKLWLHRQIIRYAYYLGNIILFFLAAAVHWLFLLVIILGLVGYMAKFWKRWSVYSRNLLFFKKIIGFILLPAVVIFGDFAKMCGWPVGVYERWSGKIKFQE